jgi:hypothetical protein
MVKRFALSLVVGATLMLARPASAQDFSRLDMAFGYGNYGLEVGPSTDDRVHGFVMHTDINLVRWFTFENVTGAYSAPADFTLITNTFGVKLVARDVLDGRVSPYVAGGFGIGYFSSNVSGGSISTGAARYGAGIDLNMGDAMAIRFDVGGLALGTGYIRDEWQSQINVTAGVVFSLGN